MEAYKLTPTLQSHILSLFLNSINRKKQKCFLFSLLTFSFLFFFPFSIVVAVKVTNQPRKEDHHSDFISLTVTNLPTSPLCNLHHYQLTSQYSILNLSFHVFSSLMQSHHHSPMDQCCCCCSSAMFSAHKFLAFTLSDLHQILANIMKLQCYHF